MSKPADQKRPSRARHGIRKYNRGCRCDICTAAKIRSDELRRAADDRYNQTRRNRRGRPRSPAVTIDWICEQCGTNFTRKQNGRSYRFCSLKCFATNNASQNPNNICRSREKTLRAFVCDRCGDQFTREGRRSYRFCSKKCADDDRAEHHHPNLKSPPPGFGTLTHCGAGHELTPENRVARTGQCLTCVKQNQKYANDASIDAAHRRGREWTGPELEIASREDLTSPQVAGMIGRTVYGVETVRSRLKREPKLIQLAGLAR
jgi:ribosomal protein L24E